MSIREPERLRKRKSKRTPKGTKKIHFFSIKTLRYNESKDYFFHEFFFEALKKGEREKGI